MGSSSSQDIKKKNIDDNYQFVISKIMKKKKKKLIYSISCPSCNEPFGKNFISSGFDLHNFNCFKCSGSNYSNYYKCKICNGFFCTICPQNRYKHYAKCPLCNERPGNEFKASGLEEKSFTCFKCGRFYFVENNYYSCKNCNAIFCPTCPYKRNK